MDALHDGTMDHCLQRGIAPMAWSPLGGGDLFRSDSTQATRVRQTLQTVGKELGDATVDQVALAWLLRHPARIIPILGTGKFDRVQSAAGAMTFELSREQWFTIWSASAGEPVP
jgi:predicted oxidoreductase